MSIIGHIKAGRVRIYKLNTFKTFTDSENAIYNDKHKNGLITISQRLRAIDEDGEEIDGLSAELGKAFGSIGVNIEDANGDLRST